MGQALLDNAFACSVPFLLSWKIQYDASKENSEKKVTAKVAAITK